ncbi:hypothetical protein ORV05_32710 [Amycolatopsis cynarae]|uniref:Uncharacterized protein n=1 Tax=Amycolatopsis cynarae TaxID=2995223 RepID=A0ABY7B0Y7_9PSEU|nr:hypothetical protein [Amycolatopsis sp. HUAS 11-8]WAL65592.1 hypothetical protein ORV05_32710 [Amycolatopsis sp. HUAS 11-8]
MVDFELAQGQSTRDSCRDSSVERDRPGYEAFVYQAAFPESGSMKSWTDDRGYCHTYWDDDKLSALPSFAPLYPWTA